MAKEKTGIYTLTGSHGNLVNIVNGELIMSEETKEAIEEELWRYVSEPKRSPTEYIIIKQKDGKTRTNA